jgi:uncharacterized membrane protein
MPGTDWLHHSFGIVCHQIAERSIGAGGYLMPLCARCAGLYCGVLAVSLWVLIQGALGWKPRLSRSSLLALIVLGAACVADGLTGTSHAIGATNVVRFALGAGAGAFVTIALSVLFWASWPEKRTTFRLDSGDVLLGLLTVPVVTASGLESSVLLKALTIGSLMGLALLHAWGLALSVSLSARLRRDPAWLGRLWRSQGARAAALAAGTVVTLSAPVAAQDEVERCVVRSRALGDEAVKAALDSASSARVLSVLRARPWPWDLRGSCAVDPGAHLVQLDARLLSAGTPSPTPSPTGWALLEHECVLREARKLINEPITIERPTDPANLVSNSCHISDSELAPADLPKIHVYEWKTSIDRTDSIKACIKNGMASPVFTSETERVVAHFGIHALGTTPTGVKESVHDAVRQHMVTVEQVCAITGGHPESWRPPRNPIIHPGLFLGFIGLTAALALVYNKKAKADWDQEKDRLRDGLLAELKLPRATGDEAARRGVLALLSARKDGVGGEELWLAFLKDRIVSVHADGRRTSIPFSTLKKLDLVELASAGFSIAIQTSSGKTDIDGRLHLQGAADMVRIVNILLRQGVSVGYQKA